MGCCRGYIGDNGKEIRNYCLGCRVWGLKGLGLCLGFTVSFPTSMPLKWGVKRKRRQDCLVSVEGRKNGCGLGFGVSGDESTGECRIRFGPACWEPHRGTITPKGPPLLSQFPNILVFFGIPLFRGSFIYPRCLVASCPAI